MSILSLVTGRNKHIIEDHFDRQFELESTLRDRGRLEIIDSLASEIPPPGSASFTRQQEPLGLGHAVWCARDLIGAEPFALLLPDVLIRNAPGCLAQMIKASERVERRANIIAVEETRPDQLHMYGVVGVGARKGRLFSITSMVEKPSPTQAPSNFIVTGRYLLQPEIFNFLGMHESGVSGEIQLTDAMIALGGTQAFYGFEFEGRSCDCGSKVCFPALSQSTECRIASTCLAQSCLKF